MDAKKKSCTYCSPALLQIRQFRSSGYERCHSRKPHLQHLSTAMRLNKICIDERIWQLLPDPPSHAGMASNESSLTAVETNTNIDAGWTCLSISSCRQEILYEIDREMDNT